MTVENIEANK